MTLCANGHDLDLPGMKIETGSHRGRCAECRREGKRTARARQRAEKERPGSVAASGWKPKKQEPKARTEAGSVSVGRVRRGRKVKSGSSNKLDRARRLVEPTLAFLQLDRDGGGGGVPAMVTDYPPIPIRVLVADPPWPSPPMHIRHGVMKGSPASPPYPVMKPAQIMSYPLPPLADVAVLFLWRLSSMQELAIAVCHAWGFKVYGEVVWNKLTVKGNDWFGMGTVVRGSHETCLIGIRYPPGRWREARPAVALKDRFSAVVGPHSRKPEELQDMIEKLYPEGPWAELFARRRRPGWFCYGLEVDGADVAEAGVAEEELTDGQTAW